AALSPKLSIASLTLAMAGLVVFLAVTVASVFQVPGTDNGLAFIVAAVASAILGVAAVVTGVVARRRGRRGEARRGGIALAGIVLGVVAVVLPALLGGWVGYLLYARYQEFEHCIRAPETASPRYLCLKECPGILDSLCRKQINW